MALVAYACFKLMHKKIGKLASYIVGGVLAEMLMVSGYFVFEGILYGFIPSLVNIPANGVQGIAGVVIGTIMIRVFDRLKISVE